MPTSYAELLLSDQWQEKRLAILRRDKLVCEHCKNSKIKAFKHSLGVLKGRTLNSKSLVFNLSNQTELTVHIKAFFLNQVVYREMLFYYEEKLDYKIPVAGMRLSRGNAGNINGPLNPDEWVFVNNLHVHHQYYILGNSPWEYEDNALQTLCWDCHENLHVHAKVPVYFGKDRRLLYSMYKMSWIRFFSGV